MPNPLTAVGRPGTACAGRTFTITLIDPLQGKYRFTPDAPIILGSSSGTLAERRCVIDFTVDVRRAPSIDSDPATPGLQTEQKAFVAATDITQGPNFGLTGGGIGTTGSTVARATPVFATQASPTFELGEGTLTDTATVTGLASPITADNPDTAPVETPGTVTFVLYGPGDTNCTTPILTRAGRPLTLNGAATSGTATSGAGFAPTAVRTYRWIAAYSGDANNASVASACGDANEQTVVTRATPAVATQASPTIELGEGTLTDLATVTGLVNPVTGAGAGTVTFTLYGPNDANCTTPILTRAGRPLTLGGAATSGTATSGAGFAPTAVGTYRWIAAYSGDANNAPVAGACGDANEQTVVTGATPSVATQASPTITLGEGTLTDSATVTGLVNPVTGAGAGTVTFTLYGPNDTNSRRRFGRARVVR